MAGYNFGEAYEVRQERLRALELQIAQLGDTYAPPHMLVERDNLENELAMIRKANEPQPSKELLDAVDEATRYHGMISAVMALSGRVYELQRGVDTLRRIVAFLPWVLVAVVIVIEILVRL